MNYLNKKNIKDIDAEGKSVFLRCDFNVPYDDKGNITDTKRIDESVKTIKYLLDRNAKVILCSHLGSPKGKRTENLSLAPVAAYLSEILGQKVRLAPDVIGPGAQSMVKSLKNGEACMLENVRFEPGETTNDPEFAQKLASFADVYINDAFGTCHRAHASTAGITRYLPSGCGFLVEKEILAINGALQNPKRPVVLVLGGAKVSDKINVINAFLDKIDVLVIGGGMSYTFTNALGYSVGTSICENDYIGLAQEMMAKAKEKGIRFLLPVDIKVGEEYSPDTSYKIVDADKIPDGKMGLDIGPKTAKLFAQAISEAATVIWNGPMGVCEWENFASGTHCVAQAIAKSSAVSVIGGGTSAEVISKLGLSDKVTHVSTGGGASLRLLEGKPLPALDALDDK